MATEIGVLVSDRMQLMMPVFHVGSRFLQLGAHLRGATVVFHCAFDPEEIVQTMGGRAHPHLAHGPEHGACRAGHAGDRRGRSLDAAQDGTPEQVRRRASIAQAAPDVDIRIADDAGRALPNGTPGEILTRTATHMVGCWNKSAATMKALRRGWYRTGDPGYMDDGGASIRWTARRT